MINLLLALVFAAATLSGPDLVERSIRYHDPHEVWPTLEGRFEISETRPDGTERQVVLTLDLESGDYTYDAVIGENAIHRELSDGRCIGSLNGERDLADELKDEHRLTCPQITSYRNYYRYLWGLPMNLRDPGAIIHEETSPVKFDGEVTIRVKVTYEPDVGSDVWYFYFRPGNGALVGAQFYHDESANDGEVIYFDDEFEALGMRIPQTRRWYMSNDGQYLGADRLVKLSRTAE